MPTYWDRTFSIARTILQSGNEIRPDQSHIGLVIEWVFISVKHKRWSWYDSVDTLLGLRTGLPNFNFRQRPCTPLLVTATKVFLGSTSLPSNTCRRLFPQRRERLGLIATTHLQVTPRLRRHGAALVACYHNKVLS